MSTPTQIENAVGAWLAAAMPARVLVRARIGEAPAPASPYLLYSLDAVEAPDSIRSETSEDAQRIEAADSRLTFVIEVVGDRPGQTVRDDALRLGLSLRATQRTGDLFKVCGLWALGPLQNLTALETGTMRQRVRFTLTLSATLDSTETPETIGEVETGVFEGTIPAEITIQTTEPA